MKTPLVSLALLLALLASPAPAQDKPLKERAAETVETLKRETREATVTATRAARQAWKATKAYLAEDPAEFREGASRRLDELAAEIAELKEEAQRGPLVRRPYFSTRVKALTEHLAFARAELAKLPPAKKGDGTSPLRQQFNHTLEHLEAAVDQARAEARDAR